MGNATPRHKSHCPAGHEYAGWNLIVHKSGARDCRACTYARTREHKRRVRAAARALNPQVTLAERFWSKVDAEGDCWEWTAGKCRGYGLFRVQRQNVLAHRWAWEYLVGPIPEGLHIDHLCRNPPCVNPDHLEPVTQAENTRRGAAGIWARSKTHCPQGHPYTGENLVIERHAERVGRACRECRRQSSMRYVEKKRAEFGQWPLPQSRKKAST